MKLEGGCYCGQVRYEAEGDPMLQAQCHCRECQYLTGGAPNLVTREFCGECGAHLTTRPPAFPAVIVKVGSLDDPSVFEPQMAIFTCDRQPFHQIAEGLSQFEKLPG